LHATTPDQRERRRQVLAQIQQAQSAWPAHLPAPEDLLHQDRSR
jgi:hypothetical protein